MARMDRHDMADMRAMEIQHERHNPLNPVRGRGAVPSTGLSQFVGGSHHEHEAYEGGRHLARHIANMHGGAYHKAFVRGMGDCEGMQGGGHVVGGSRTGSYEGQGTGGGPISGLNIPILSGLAGMFGLGKKPSKVAIRKALMEIKKTHPEAASKATEYLHDLKGGLTGAGFLDTIMSFINSIFGKKSSASPPSHSAPPPSHSAPPPSHSPPSAAREESAADQLAKYGIHDKSSFRKWAAKGGHPDKGGDVATFQKVSGLAGQLGWSGGARGGAKKPVAEGDGRRKRAAVVRKVMHEKGLSMIEASKYVKAHNLY